MTVLPAAAVAYCRRYGPDGPVPNRSWAVRLTAENFDEMLEWTKGQRGFRTRTWEGEPALGLDQTYGVGLVEIPLGYWIVSPVKWFFIGIADEVFRMDWVLHPVQRHPAS